MLSKLRTADFDFDLPAELIAQHPTHERDQSRLLVLNRRAGNIEHRRFGNLLEYVEPGDALVLNDSKVIPARLRGRNEKTAGEFEMLLLEETATNEWWTMLRPGKRARVGTQIRVRTATGRDSEALATVLEVNEEGHRRLRFGGVPDILDRLVDLGEVPLPPYVSRAAGGDLRADQERYQTVYAKPPGSVAAPTAGLHFTQPLLEHFRSRGVRVCFLTLHVSLGTFAPVKSESIEAHRMHEERYEISAPTVRTITEVKRARKRVFAVGTTTVRVLESVAAQNRGSLIAGSGRTRIFICPPYEFHVADALVTNFHLPRSTLMMLVSAFAAPGQTRGREAVLAAYREAIRDKYRFFSYGDAMLLL